MATLVNSLSSLRILILNRCNLGLAGIIQLIQSLSGNDSLEELHVAENMSTALENALPCSPMPHFSSPTCQNTERVSKQDDSTTCVTNTKFDNMQVADSEDEEPQTNASKVNTNTSNNICKSDGSCASSCHGGPHGSSQLVQELCEAILCAKQLKMIDLSRNGFDKDAVELLYSAWGLNSGSRGKVLTRKHVTKDCIHFYVEGVKCCGVKPCCKRE